MRKVQWFLLGIVCALIVISALKYYEKTKDQSKGDGDEKKINSIYVEQALKNLNIDNYQEALVSLSKAEKAMPNDPRITSLLAYCYFSLEDYRNAIDFYNKAIDGAPAFPNNYIYLGVAYVRNGEKEKAQATFDQLLDLLTSQNKKGRSLYVLIEEFMEKAGLDH